MRIIALEAFNFKTIQKLKIKIKTSMTLMHHFFHSLHDIPASSSATKVLRDFLPEIQFSIA